MSFNPIVAALIFGSNSSGGSGESTVVISSESSRIIEGYSVPNMTEEQIISAYNALATGKPCILTNSSDTMHFMLNQADSLSNVISVQFVYFDKLLITYSIEGDAVYETHSEIGSEAIGTKVKIAGIVQTEWDATGTIAGAEAGATAYQKPTEGIPASDIADGVIPDIPTNISAFVNDSKYVTDIADLPADGTDAADFNAEDIDTDDVYGYLDDLIAKHPNYISKETLGKDESGNYDINRYVLFGGTYLAYEKENYPKMYAWKNGNTIIYSTSVSPRFGDSMYSTAYIGTSAGTVSAIDNANETRTVNGVVYTRDKTADVKPTLIYSKSGTDGFGKKPGEIGNMLYNASGTYIGRIVTTDTDSQGRLVITSYAKDGTTTTANFTRKPFCDTNSLTEDPNTLVIIANEHGMDFDPAEPAIICCRVIKKMCGTGGDEFINFLRSCKVVFIPVANPWGFNTKKHSLVNRYGGISAYMNYNARNFHRNYDTQGWTYSDESSTETLVQAQTRNAAYGGSEIETQYVMNTMYGATLGFAVHCMPSTESAQGEMLLQSVSMAGNEDFQSLVNELWGKYAMALSNQTNCAPNEYAKPSSYAIANCKNGGALFEMNRRIRFDMPMHDSKIMRADYQEMFGVVKIFAKLAGIWNVGGASYPDGDMEEW